MLRHLLLYNMLACSALGVAGCGTTRWTDTSRTATEQMLVSDAIERSVSKIDFRNLQGHEVYLDTSYLPAVVDKDYLISTLRQHMLASGCVMKEKKDDAEFVVEARAGAVGTDRHDLLFGIPSMTLPVAPVAGAPSAIPEIAFARRTDQKGVAKVAVFAYHRTTGEPVWQSGVDTIASKAQNSWLLGVGPIQKGTIYDKAQFAGRDFRFPLLGRKQPDDPRTVRVTRETKFNEPQRFAMRTSDELAKFGEELKLPAKGGTTLAGQGSAGGGAAVNAPSVFNLPNGDWANSYSPQLNYSVPTEFPPTARLIGPVTQ